jgi:hypothetical protein
MKEEAQNRPKEKKRGIVGFDQLFCLEFTKA